MTSKEKNEFKTALKGYKRMTSPIIKTFSKYGLYIKESGNHYKIERTDHIGGCVTISKTPSDFRSGMNAAHQLINLIETPSLCF